MYGDLATKLMLEAKRSANLNELPLFLHNLVKDIVLEILDLNKDLTFLNQQISDNTLTDEDSRRVNQCQLFVAHLCMRRNKRCLLAYQKHRADKIDEFLWLNIEPILNSEVGKSKYNSADANFTKNGHGINNLFIEDLSHPEQEYHKHYQELVMDLKSSLCEIDISGDLSPPTDIFIDVRVLKEGGEVQTEYGVFNLIKDSQFFVRKTDVDRLIQQGFLEEI